MNLQPYRHTGLATPSRSAGLDTYAAPVQPRSHLHFVSQPGREEALARLPEGARANLYEVAGPVLDWWAAPADHGRGVEAIVIGQDAITVANPRPHPNADGKTVYDTCRRRIVRDSWSFHEFRDHPQPWRAGAPQPTAGHTGGGDPRFGATWLSLLALLPADAQRFVLHPFIGVSRDNLIADVHSVRYTRLGRADLTMLLWVWDRRAAVLVSAQVSGPVDHQAAWAAESVVCRHVQRPAGTWRL